MAVELGRRVSILREYHYYLFVKFHAEEPWDTTSSPETSSPEKIFYFLSYIKIFQFYHGPQFTLIDPDVEAAIRSDIACKIPGSNEIVSWAQQDNVIQIPGVCLKLWRLFFNYPYNGSEHQRKKKEAQWILFLDTTSTVKNKVFIEYFMCCG